MSTAAPAIEQLSHSTHSCLIYQNADQQLAITAQFLKIGLERGERCVFLEIPAKLERVRAALGALGVDVLSEVQRGALVLSAKRDYLVQGRFDGATTVRFLAETLKDALAAGFTALRAAGDMNWELGADQDFRLLIDYEAELDQFATSEKIVGMCQYQRHTVSSLAIRNALETHETVVLGDQLCPENVFYQPPDVNLETDAERREQKRSEWMCHQLSRSMKNGGLSA